MEAGKRMNSRLPSRFYKTISDCPDHPISISTLFMETFGDSLGDSVFLRDSRPGEAAEWEVGLKHINGGTWLEKGWEEFVRFYSINQEYLLMFNYLGNSRFRVIICDKAANEIAYPVKETVTVKVEPEEEDDGPVLGKEREKGKKNPQMPYMEVMGRQFKKRIAYQNSDRSCGRKVSKPSGKENLSTYESGFESENPYFAIRMKTTYLDYHAHVHIPCKFWRSNFSGTNFGWNFNLRLSDGETKWPVIVGRYRKDRPGDHGRIHGAGWKEFAKDAKISVGEVCIFELLKEEKFFIVHKSE